LRVFAKGAGFDFLFGSAYDAGSGIMHAFHSKPRKASVALCLAVIHLPGRMFAKVTG
jgi:hypothetical protein